MVWRRGYGGVTMRDEQELRQRVLAETVGFLGGLGQRPVRARADVDGVAATLGGALQDEPMDRWWRPRS